MSGFFSSKAPSSQKYLVGDGDAASGADLGVDPPDGQDGRASSSGVSSVYARSLTPSVVVPTGLMASDSVMRSLQSQVRSGSWRRLETFQDHVEESV